MLRLYRLWGIKVLCSPERGLHGMKRGGTAWPRRPDSLGLSGRTLRQVARPVLPRNITVFNMKKQSFCWRQVRWLMGLSEGHVGAPWSNFNAIRIAGITLFPDRSVLSLQPGNPSKYLVEVRVHVLKLLQKALPAPICDGQHQRVQIPCACLRDDQPPARGDFGSACFMSGLSWMEPLHPSVPVRLPNKTLQALPASADFSGTKWNQNACCRHEETGSLRWNDADTWHFSIRQPRVAAGGTTWPPW